MIEYRLRAVLKERGRTLYWLAKQLDLNESALSKAASGKTSGLKFEVLDRICDLLEIQPGELLLHIPNKKKSKPNK
jgi:putative transcriptional regulator